MRIVFLHHLYKDLVLEIRAAVANQKASSSEVKALYDNANPNAHGLELCLREVGVEMHALPANADAFLEQWGTEQGVQENNTDTLLIKWLQYLKPEIIFYGPHYTGLLRKIRAEVVSVKKIVIAANSPFHDLDILKLCDGVVGCIPSVVHRLQAQGLQAHYVPHGFPAHVLAHLPPPKTSPGIFFLGSIVREKDFHEEREKLLLALKKAKLPLHILTPGAKRLSQEPWLTYAKQLTYVLSGPIRHSRFMKSVVGATAAMEKLFALRSMPIHPVHPDLRAVIQPPLFGMHMYAALRDAQVVLNTHIDFAGPDASNMRLFEATGVGGCLLTDWKPNLGDFFEDGTELLSYKNEAECSAKAKELLENTELTLALRAAAQKRTLAAHTLAHRAPLYKTAFEEILRK